ARAVVEDVAQVRAAARAVDLGPAHSVARVLLGLDGARRRRLPEARPARPRVELLTGREELRAARGAEILARLVVVPVAPGEGALRALLPADGVLLGRQLRAPLLVRLDDLVAHVSQVSELCARRQRGTRGRDGRAGGGSVPALAGRGRLHLAQHLREVGVAVLDDDRPRGVALDVRQAVPLALELLHLRHAALPARQRVAVIVLRFPRGDRLTQRGDERRRANRLREEAIDLALVDRPHRDLDRRLSGDHHADRLGILDL